MELLCAQSFFAVPSEGKMQPGRWSIAAVVDVDCPEADQSPEKGIQTSWTGILRSAWPSLLTFLRLKEEEMGCGSAEGTTRGIVS